MCSVVGVVPFFICDIHFILSLCYWYHCITADIDDKDTILQLNAIRFGPFNSSPWPLELYGWRESV